MRTRDFGKTGLKVSALVFGGGAVGGLLIDKDEATKRRAIERALEAGINWIDTAAAYGQGRSEEALGALLGGMAQPPYISTKFSVDGANPVDLRGQIERSLEASLKRLKRQSVTLLQLHNPIAPVTDGRTLGFTDVLKPGGVLDVLDDLKRQGYFAHYGITALGHAPSVVRVIESGRIASAQVYYNLLNPSAARALPAAWPAYDFSGILAACKAQGVAAMNIRVFSAGVIATDARHGRERPLTAGDTVDSETAKARAVLRTLGDGYGTRAQTAIRFALAQPALACIIFGLAELSHLEEAIEAEAMGPLPQEALDKIEAAYASGI